MRKLLLELLAVSLAASAAPAAWADALDSGLWDTSWGKVRFEKEGGKYVGRLTDSGKVCGFSKGDEVLRGQVEDELFTGEGRVCYPAKCAEPEWSLALALSARSPARWIGGVLEPSRGCSASPKGAIKLERPKATAPTSSPSVVNVRYKSKETESLVNDALAARMEMDLRTALRALKAAEQKEPDHPYVLELMSDIYRQQKDFDQAKACLARLAKRDPIGGFYNLACMEAQYGSREQAVRYLEKSVAAGWSQVEAAEKDADLAPVRATAGWEQLRQKMIRNAEREKKSPKK